MTYITTRNDETHWRIHFADNLKVFLDDAEVQFVTEADDVEGFVVEFVRDEDGNVQVDGDEIATVRRTGKVRFEGERAEAAA